jgi:hypothetical protein
MVSLKFSISLLEPLSAQTPQSVDEAEHENENEKGKRTPFNKQIALFRRAGIIRTVFFPSFSYRFLGGSVVMPRSW